jgi:hypothetical protein
MTSERSTIPCHRIHVGQSVILQKRPCQITRITTSSTTGQHQYLGVDLFTDQLAEETCVVKDPSPSFVLHNMVTPSFKEYNVIQAGDGCVMFFQTDSGEVKTGVAVIAQGGLSKKINEAFTQSLGAVRVFVISEGKRELMVDFMVVHNAYKL